jgi:hypothetical protein
MRPPKVLDAVVGLTVLALAAFGGAVGARLTDTHDVMCWNPERRVWDAFAANVSARREGDWLLLRRGIPPQTIARVHASVVCVAILSGAPE